MFQVTNVDDLLDSKEQSKEEIEKEFIREVEQESVSIERSKVNLTEKDSQNSSKEHPSMKKN